MSLELEVEAHTRQHAVIKVTGRLDVNSAPALKEELKRTVASGFIWLVIDLHGVSFLDSSGLSALVSGLKTARERNGTLVLARVGEEIQTTLELTRLNRVFRTYPDVDTALASFQRL